MGVCDTRGAPWRPTNRQTLTVERRAGVMDTVQDGTVNPGGAGAVPLCFDDPCRGWDDVSRRGLAWKVNRYFLAGLVATIILGPLCDIAGAQQKTIEARKHNQRGRVYYNRGNYAKAIEEFQRAVRLTPNDVEARANLASAYERLDRLAEAEREIRIAIAQRPDRAANYGVVGAIYAKGGKL